MAQETRSSLRPLHVILAALTAGVSVGLGVYQLAFLGILLAIAGLLILIFGLFILPRNPGPREWKRSGGVWAIGTAMLLFAATTFLFQQQSSETALPLLFWVAGFLALMLGVALLWHKT